VHFCDFLFYQELSGWALPRAPHPRNLSGEARNW